MHVVEMEAVATASQLVQPAAAQASLQLSFSAATSNSTPAAQGTPPPSATPDVRRSTSTLPPFIRRSKER
jgi:hypothetical protein